MSRTIILAGLFAAAAALAPTTTYAQHVDGAVALLGQDTRAFPFAAPRLSRTHADPVDGEQALLGRSITHRTEAVSQLALGVVPAAMSVPFDGGYALLGRR